jgi:acid phosphatase family membrane protein YuiD
MLENNWVLILTVGGLASVASAAVLALGMHMAGLALAFFAFACFSVLIVV